MLSLKLRCLSETSKTPIKTFFRYVTLFYENGCMVAADETNPDSGEVTVSTSCASKLFTVFTDDPFTLEKCLWDTFENAGDITSKNLRLDQDAMTISQKFKDERFRNPSLFIDGNPYHEPNYPD